MWVRGWRGCGRGRGWDDGVATCATGYYGVMFAFDILLIHRIFGSASDA